MLPLHVQQSINLISEKNIQLELDNEKIVVRVLKNGATPKCTQEAIKLIIAYFRVDLHYLDKTLGESFQTFKQGIKHLDSENEHLKKIRKNTNEKMKLFQDGRTRRYSRAKIDEFNLEKVSDRPVHIICEVSPPPKNRLEMLKNLHMANNNSNYILSEDFAVFDCTIGEPPALWSKLGVFKAIKRQISEEAKIKDNETEGMLESLKTAQLLYRPVKVSLIGIIVHVQKEPENGAMKIDLMGCLTGNIPVLTTSHLMYETLNDQKYGKNLAPFLKERFNVYRQKKGDIVVILPSSHSLQDIGIKSSEFIKAGNFSKPFVEGTFDLSQVFMDDTEDQIFRLIPFGTGHGSSSIHGNGRIIGFPIPMFLKNWEILSEKMDFCFLSSCFLGGGSMLQLTAAAVKCPVIIQSSTDLPSTTSHLFTIHLALNLAALKLYPQDKGPNRGPKQLSHQDLKEIGSLAFDGHFSGKDGELKNMQSFLLPAYNPDIPNVAYSGFISPKIMDVDKEIRNLKELDFENDVFEDDAKDRILYFFSQPVLPITIINKTVQGIVALASRGGNNFHIINGLQLPNIEFKDIVDKTLANRAHPDKSGANKLFVIGRLSCKINGKSIDLKNVVIAAVGTGTFIACKVHNKGYYIVNSTDDLDFINHSTVSEDKICRLLYSHALACAPSIEQLKINVAGRQGPDNFFEKLHQLVWKKRAPLQVQLFDLILQKGTDLELRRVKKKLLQEKRELIVNEGVVFAIRSHYLGAVKELMSGLSINGKDSTGVPLLHHAILSGNESIIQFFLKEGADPFEKNQKISGYELASANIPIFKLLIEGREIHEWNRLFSLRWPPICHAMATSNIPFFNFLIEKKIHLITKMGDYPFIGFAVALGNIEFVKLLMDNGLSLDIKHNGIHLIFAALEKGSPELIQLFVDHCPNINVRNKEGLTPLELTQAKGQMELNSILHKFTRYNESINTVEESESKFISIIKHYKNALSLFGVEPKITPEMEDQLLKVLKMKGDLTDLVELCGCGYVFSQEFYQKIVLVLIGNPNFKHSLRVLDLGGKLTQQQCNQWILNLIRYGRSDLIKELKERGYELQQMTIEQKLVVEKILIGPDKNALISSLMAAVEAGLDLRKLANGSQLKIASHLSDRLKDMPDVLDMLSKLLHLEF